MHQRLLLLVLSVALLFCSPVNANTNTIDSLKVELQSVQTDTTRINLLIELGCNYSYIRSSEAIPYLKYARQLSADIGFRRGYGRSLFELGNHYRSKSIQDTALFYQTQALSVMESLSDSFGIAEIEMKIGVIHEELGNHAIAIRHCLRSLGISIRNDFISIRGVTEQCIANIHTRLGNFDKARYYYAEAQIHDLNPDKTSSLAISNNNIGLVFAYQGDYETSIIHFEKAIALCEEGEHPEWLGDALNNAGILYRKLGDYDKAKAAYLRCQQVRRASEDHRGEIQTLINLGVFSFHLGEMEAAVDYYEEALAQADSGGYYYEIQRVLLNLAEIESIQGNFEDAYTYQAKYQTLKDSLFDPSNSEYIAELTTKFESKEKDAEIRALQKAQKIYELAQNQNRTVILGLFGFIGLLVIIAALLIRQKKLQAKKKSLELEQVRSDLHNRLSVLEQKALQLQMNPHFIFNALNAIQGYISKNDRHSANAYLSRFARLMRLTLDNSRVNQVLISDEIDLLESYLKLTSLLSDSELTYNIEMDPRIDPENSLIPSMMLQPFVENAVVHGILPGKKEGIIRILFQLKQERLLCVIEDNGIGRDASLSRKYANRHKSAAMEVTRERLSLLSENNELQLTITDLINDQRQAKGTRVEIELPLVQAWDS